MFAISASLYIIHTDVTLGIGITRDRLRMPRLSVMPYTDRSILAEEVSDDHSRERARAHGRTLLTGRRDVWRTSDAAGV